MASKKKTSQSDEYGDIVARAQRAASTAPSKCLTRTAAHTSQRNTRNSNKCVQKNPPQKDKIIHFDKNFKIARPPNEPTGEQVRPAKVARQDLFEDSDDAPPPAPPAPAVDNPPAPPALAIEKIPAPPALAIEELPAPPAPAAAEPPAPHALVEDPPTPAALALDDPPAPPVLAVDNAVMPSLPAYPSVVDDPPPADDNVEVNSDEEEEEAIDLIPIAQLVNEDVNNEDCNGDEEEEG